MAKKTKKGKRSSKRTSKKALDNQWTDEEVREAYTKLVRFQEDPTKMLSTGPFMKSRRGELTKEQDKALYEKIIITLGFENDHTVAMTVSKKYRGLAIELRRQMIGDLQCKTHTEKVLVDAVVNAYIRTLRYSEAMTAMIDFDNSLWPEKTNFLSMIGKELDRANRHLLASYQMLIQLKQPPLKVQVKANNAFIGQAQQFNVDKKGVPAYG
jgi:hypothetical protein